MNWEQWEARRQKGQAHLAPDLDITHERKGKKKGVRSGQAGTFYVGKTLARNHQGVLDLSLARFSLYFRRVATKQPTLGCLRTNGHRSPRMRETGQAAGEEGGRCVSLQK